MLKGRTLQKWGGHGGTILTNPLRLLWLEWIIYKELSLFFLFCHVLAPCDAFWLSHFFISGTQHWIPTAWSSRGLCWLTVADPDLLACMQQQWDARAWQRKTPHMLVLGRREKARNWKGRGTLPVKPTSSNQAPCPHSKPAVMLP